MIIVTGPLLGVKQKLSNGGCWQHRTTVYQ